MRPEPQPSARPERRFTVKPLQRLWLRELGLEKLWLAGSVPESKPAPVSVPVPKSATSSAPATALITRTRRIPLQKAASTPVAAGARPGLDELCEQVRACTACGLATGRKQAVFGAGAQGASWLIVGEAPGEPRRPARFALCRAVWPVARRDVGCCGSQPRPRYLYRQCR